MKMPHWVCYLLGVKCRNEKILNTIQKHEEITKRADEAITKAIAALDGETGWWTCRCDEKEKKECNIHDT